MLAVQEERGRGFRGASFAKGTNVGVDQVVDLLAGVIRLELRKVQAELPREADKIAVQRVIAGDPAAAAARILVLVQHIVHLPELVLQRRGFGGTRTGKSVAVQLGERQITELEANLVGVLSCDLLDDREVLAAEGAFVVAVFYKFYTSGAFAFDVIRGSAAARRVGLFLVAYPDCANDNHANNAEHRPKPLVHMFIDSFVSIRR